MALAMRGLSRAANGPAWQGPYGLRLASLDVLVLARAGITYQTQARQRRLRFLQLRNVQNAQIVPARRQHRIGVWI